MSQNCDDSIFAAGDGDNVEIVGNVNFGFAYVYTRLTFVYSPPSPPNFKFLEITHPTPYT